METEKVEKTKWELKVGNKLVVVKMEQKKWGTKNQLW